jgi:hypothetical protein
MSKIEDEPTKNHCGLAVAYLQRGLNLCNTYTQLKTKIMLKTLTNQDIAKLKPLYSAIQTAFFQAQKQN